MSNKTSYVVIPFDLWQTMNENVVSTIPFNPSLVILSESEYSGFVMNNAGDIDMELLDEVSQLPTYKLVKED